MVSAGRGAFRLADQGDARFRRATPSPARFLSAAISRASQNGPSPDWLKRRLTAIGLRPISALVDITNYITFAYARPLHVFDADKVKGNIHVTPRRGRRGDLAALDGKTYALDPEMTVIADDGDRKRSAASSAASMLGLLRRDGERVPRGRLFRSVAHRGDRPQARGPVPTPATAIERGSRSGLYP